MCVCVCVCVCVSVCVCVCVCVCLCVCKCVKGKEMTESCSSSHRVSDFVVQATPLSIHSFNNMPPLAWCFRTMPAGDYQVKVTVNGVEVTEYCVSNPSNCVFTVRLHLCL